MLNVDDPHVAVMASQHAGRILRIGTTSGCDLWADEVTARWPDGLTFRLHAGGERHRVETRLVGTHGIAPALAALAAARHCGMTLPDTVRAVARVTTLPGRLQPVGLPQGATVLRDDYNASVDALDTALSALELARAVRRVLVVSDGAVVDLAVGHHPDGVVLVPERLVPVDEVHDGQASPAEAGAGADVETATVRAAAAERRHHPLDEDPVHGRRCLGERHARDAAHASRRVP